MIAGDKLLNNSVGSGNGIRAGLASAKQSSTMMIMGVKPISLDEAVPSERWELAEEFVITPELNQQFMDSLDDHHPWYADDSPYGGPIAEPGVLHEKAFCAMGRRFPVAPGPGGSLHAKQESELHYPARVGTRVKIEVRLIDKYVKRKRDYIVMEARCTDNKNRLLLLSRWFRMIGKKVE